MTDLTWRRALAWRMERHGLVETRFSEPAAVAQELCGLHAQVMSSAEHTARVRGAEGVAEALAGERLVKTWAVRGTLHLLPVSELGMWQAALSTFDHFLRPAWVRGFGFTSPEAVEDLVAAVGEALTRDRTWTREELAQAIPEHADKLRESWGSALKPAAFRGHLVFAESSGQHVRFTAPPPVERPPVDEALREITRRYLHAYAPARREDLSRWWGTHALSAAKAQRRIEDLGDEVAQVDVEGARCWVLRDDLEALRDAGPRGAARLVPLFDQYVVNSNRGVEQLLPAAVREKVFRQAGWISPALLVDGAIAGVWRHERKGARVLVEIEPFGRVTATVRKQAAVDAERFAAALGGRLELSWS